MRRTFEAFEESVGSARRFVSLAIADLPGDIQDSVNLMVSELATNALVHASSGFTVAIDRSDAAVTVSVTDRGDGTPAMQSPSSSEPHGRGLRIVEALSDDWGITSSTDTGKTVWFRIALQSVPSGIQQADAVVTTNRVEPGTSDRNRRSASDFSGYATRRRTGEPARSPAPGSPTASAKTVHGLPTGAGVSAIPMSRFHLFSRLGPRTLLTSH